LLKDLREDFNLTYLFIAHNLNVVYYISERVIVMYLGRVVEMAKRDPLFQEPKHPYTERLLEAIPEVKPRDDKSKGRKKGEMRIPVDYEGTPGCSYYPRCPYRKDVCFEKVPLLRRIGGDRDRFVACHRAEGLELTGARYAL
jgi:oligopeptide/dipeptide ABC transporter ATP-binding protein